MSLSLLLRAPLDRCCWALLRFSTISVSNDGCYHGLREDSRAVEFVDVDDMSWDDLERADHAIGTQTQTQAHPHPHTRARE
jgi:hypothetical protein